MRGTHYHALTLAVALTSSLGWARHTIPRVTLPVSEGQLISLGSGITPHQNEQMAPCIEGTVDIEGKTAAEYSLDQPAIDSDINSHLFPEQGMLAYSSDSGAVPTEYKAGLLPGRRTISLSYFVKLGGRTASLRNLALNSFGQKLKADMQADQRRATCGDMFVEKVEFGGYFLATVNISFLSSVDRKTILDSGVFQFVPLDDLARELTVLGDRFGGKVKISLDLSQLGGQMNAFYSLVEKLKNKGVLSCAFPNTERCAEGIKEIYRYATQPDGVYAQFNRPMTENNLGDFAIRTAFLAPMNEVSAGFTAEPPPYGQVLPALDKLIRLAVDKQAYSNALSAWADWGDSRLNQRGMSEIKPILAKNIEIVRAAIGKCREKIEDCEHYARAAIADLAEEPLSAVFFPKSFLDVCRSEEQALSDRIIIEAIAKTRLGNRALDCYGAYVNLRDTQILDLSGLGLTDVSLLYEFDGIERLDLANNNLPRLVLGDYWPNLTLLDLSHNNLRQVKLQPTMPLIKLYLEANDLADIDGRSFPSGLSYWTIFDNPLDNIDILRQRLSKKTKHLIATPLELCALHGKSLLRHGFFNSETLAAQLADGNGPDYSKIAGTLRFEGWRLCSEIYTTYEKL